MDVTKVARVTRLGRSAVTVLVLSIGVTLAGSMPASAATRAPYPHVTKVKLKDDKVKPGDAIVVSVKAENTSLTASSRSIALSFVLSKSTKPTGGTVLRTGTLPGIAKKDDRKVEFGANVPKKLGAGTYHVLVCHPRKGLTPSVLGTVTLTIKATHGSSGESGGGSAKPSPGSSDRLPAKVLNLTNWKLTLPIGKSDDDATEVKQPALSTFSDPTYFHVDGTGKGVVFRADAGGATTSGSDYPRSELREMTNNGKDEASWSSKSGQHVMTVTEAITATPVVKPHVVAAQIHDADDDVVMIRLEKNHLFVEANGDDVGDLDSNYRLGAKFTVELRATSSGIRITYNGTKVVTYDKTGKAWYFKAGCYTQSNTDRGDKASAYGEVVIYALNVQHS